MLQLVQQKYQGAAVYPGSSTYIKRDVPDVPTIGGFVNETYTAATAAHNVMDTSQAAWELLVLLSDGSYYGYGVGHEKLTATQLQTEMEGKQLPMPSGDGIANMKRNEFVY